MPDSLRGSMPAVAAAPVRDTGVPSQKGTGVTGGAKAVLSAMAVAQENDRVVVTISTSHPAEYNAFTLSNPRRLVVDFANAGLDLPYRELPVDISILKQVRISQTSVDNIRVVRFVFDLEDVKKVNHQISSDGQTVKISFPANQPSSSGSSTPSAASKTTKQSAQENPPSGTTAVKPSAAEKKATSPKPEQQSSKTPISAKPDSTASKTAPTPSVKGDAAAVTSKASATEKTAAAARPAPTKQTSSTTSPKSEPAASKPAASVSTQTSAAQKASQAQPKATPPAPKPSQAKAQPAEVKESAAKPAQTSTAAAQPKPAAAKETPPPPAAMEIVELPPTALRADPGSLRPVSSSESKPVLLAQAPPQVQQAPPAQPPVQPKVIPAIPPQETRFGGAPLTLDLIDIPLVDFFRLMAEEGGINIVMDPEIRGTISIKVVKVPWDQILEAALVNNSLDKQIEGNLVRIARKATLQSEAKQAEDLKKATVLAADLETRIKRLNYAKAASFVPALTEQKSVRGTVVVDERSNSLVLTDIPMYLDKMTKLIESLDISQPQVEIEARIVSANRDFARDLGVQFGFVQGNLQRVTAGGPNTFGTIGGTRPAQTPSSAYAAGNPSTGRGASNATASSSGGISTGTSTNNLGNWNVNLPANLAFGGIGLSVGNILDTFLLDTAITAGESRGVAKLISQPKVTAQNNSAATITQGLRFPVQIVANNTIAVQFQNAALTLTVTPQITYEGNIVLDIHVENNTADFSRQVNGIPSIRTSESTTRVLVIDGGTTVMGGIIIESDSNTSDRVPGLASLPGIGNLFKRTSLARNSQEVLFFITPKVIK